MTSLGQILLLIAFVGTGYAACVCSSDRREFRALRPWGVFAGVAGVAALTAAGVILARALIEKDFRFAYVAQYSDQQLPWHYSLSAFWVGQAGSLLLWAWLSGVTALAYYLLSRRGGSDLRMGAFGVQMALVCFLTATMLFAADPMKASVAQVRDGAGLSPLLEHPAMLLHPPIVFLGYAGWAVPFSLALVALARGRLDAKWIQEARPWALFAWLTLGAGILLGAEWAYEELGWGGYWAWDPVENGSLIPWLTGTALIHTMISWQFRGIFKRTCLALAIATFALCHFAAFLTRSGIFSSLHAFSQSPIGWMFLLLMAVLALGGGMLIFGRRRQLRPDRRISSVWTREASVAVAAVAWILLAAVAVAGTLIVPLSGIFGNKRIVVGAAFYNNVLIPVGLVLLLTTAAAPLLRWGRPPGRLQRRMLLFSSGAGALAGLAAWTMGVRHPITLAVACLAAAAPAALLAAILLDSLPRGGRHAWIRLLAALSGNRRQYAGFLIHLGFVVLAVGITGSSLGVLRLETEMSEGDSLSWQRHTIRYARLDEIELPDKLVVQTELEVTADNGRHFVLSPAQHFHFLQQQWTTEVAIDSTWVRDFYVIAHGGEAGNQASFSLIVNPMMRWVWASGFVCLIGIVIRLWPVRPAAPRPPSEAPHWIGRQGKGTTRQTELARSKSVYP